VVAGPDVQAVAGSHQSSAERRSGPASPTRTVSGSLTIFSAAERQVCEPLLQAFARQHPAVDIDFVFGISSDLHRRYLEEAESGRPTVSLLWSSAMDLQMALVTDGHAQPHNVRQDIALPTAWRDAVVATTCEPLYMLSRHALASGTLGDVVTLIRQDPQRFHGRIVLPDIETNGLGFFALLYSSLHEPAFDEFLDAMQACVPRTAKSMPALVAAMVEGAELVLHVLDGYAMRAKVAIPELRLAGSPVTISRLALIPRDAPNPDAAAAFLCHMLSSEGQAGMAKGGLAPLPVATDEANPLRIEKDFTHYLNAITRAGLLARWRKAVGRS
jgi:iron(III) transport system substrate-binding protein